MDTLPDAFAEFATLLGPNTSSAIPKITSRYVG
jgi:hypothetical protein